MNQYITQEEEQQKRHRISTPFSKIDTSHRGKTRQCNRNNDARFSGKLVLLEKSNTKKKKKKNLKLHSPLVLEVSFQCVKYQLSETGCLLSVAIKLISIPPSRLSAKRPSRRGSSGRELGEEGFCICCLCLCQTLHCQPLPTWFWTSASGCFN